MTVSKEAIEAAAWAIEAEFYDLNVWTNAEIADVALTAAEPHLLNPARVEKALRRFISVEVDYDLHKQFECDEEDSSDHYPRLAKSFIELYLKTEED